MAGVVEGGHKLRELRMARGWTQRDIERETHGIVPSQQVSRIETGVVAEPSMKHLVALGGLYGLTPNAVAELYGYWQAPTGKAQREPAELAHLSFLVSQIPSEARSRLLGQMDLLAYLTMAQEGNTLENSALGDKFRQLWSGIVQGERKVDREKPERVDAPE